MRRETITKHYWDAIRHGDLNLIAFLLRQSAIDPTEVGCGLVEAASGGLTSVVELLGNQEGITQSEWARPLAKGIEKGHTDTVKALLASRAGQTWGSANRGGRLDDALELAAEGNRPEIMHLLIGAGADPAGVLYWLGIHAVSHTDCDCAIKGAALCKILLERSTSTKNRVSPDGWIRKLLKIRNRPTSSVCGPS